MSAIEPLSRLQKEQARLYGLGSSTRLESTRSCVLEVLQPENWAVLSRVWQGVQADYGLPAPGIAVSGRDGFQLWFSVASTIAPEQTAHFLQCLRSQYLADVPDRSVCLHPNPFADTTATSRRTVQPAPIQMEDSDQWSAFLAPDLAPVFNETPWLDFPPNPDGQADVLARLKSMSLEDFESALSRMLAAPGALTAPAPPVAPSIELTEISPCSDVPTEFTETDPKRFLLRVMNDPSVAMHLRIEAAKALLP